MEALTAGDCATLYMDENCCFRSNVGVDLHVGGHVICSEVSLFLSRARSLLRSLALALVLGASLSLSLSLALTRTHTRTHTHTLTRSKKKNTDG